MGEETEINLRRLHHDIGQLRQSIANHEILAIERDKKIDALTKQIEALTMVLFKNEVEPQNTILARIQKIETFIKILDETRFRLTGSVATAIFIVGVLGTIAGAVVTIYNSFFKK